MELTSQKNGFVNFKSHYCNQLVQFFTFSVKICRFFFVEILVLYEKIPLSKPDYIIFSESNFYKVVSEL